MIKRLLLTTALVSMSAAFADGYTPMAKDFDIKLGGDFDFQSGFRSQKKEYTNNSAGNKLGLTKNNKSVGFDTTANVYLDAKNTTAQGMTYGAHVGIQTTTTSNRNVNNHQMNQSYLFVEHKDMGRLEAGSNEDAANAMSITGASVASATGGVAGDWWKYVVLSNSTATNFANAGQFILSPAVSMNNSALLSTLNTNTEEARKLTYYTPKYNGFQLGLSYAPDVANKANAAVFPDSAVANGGLENAFAVGASWEGKMHKDHALKVAATTVMGKPKYLSSVATTARDEDTKVYNVGAKYTFQDMLSLALGYTDTNKTGLKKVTGLKKGHAYTGGVSVAMDKFTVSLTGMISEKNKNKATLYSLGADYKMAPGLMPYAEVTSFDLKQKRADDVATTADKKNKGTAFILGTKVKF
jgi:hypothetical protein